MGEQHSLIDRFAVMRREDLDSLLQSLVSSGYRLVGPVVRDGELVYDTFTASNELPAGWFDEQDAGHYRVHRDERVNLFDHASPSQSWKKFLMPASSPLWRIEKAPEGFAFDPTRRAAEPLALIGVHSCDLAAIAILDRVFLGGPYRDPGYASRRTEAFLLAVNCTRAGGTCFCASMGTGPRARGGFDLSLTEIASDGRHEFLIEIGSQKGVRVLSNASHRPAEDADLEESTRCIACAEQQMGRTLGTDGLREALNNAREHPHWSRVATRCLACGNCTMVCPTCFCSTVSDSTDLCASCSVRTKTWDSCFTLDFSYIHGGAVRRSIAARYRHWVSHKLATWVDQFGTPGCVGCGRCITWCPAQIDITQEAAAIRTASAPVDMTTT